MRQQILQEYQALIASHFVQAESDAQARQSLARLAQDLRRDIEGVQTVARVANIGAVPAIVALVALVLGWLRVRNRRPAGRG